MSIASLSTSLQTWSGVISGIGSLLLTAGLVYLYSRQTTVLKKQREIQAKQARWMEVTHQPLLNIQWTDSVQDEEDDTAYIQIEAENVGNGPAVNLRCFCKLYVTPIDFPPVFGRGEGMDVNGLPEISDLTDRENPHDPIAEVHLVPLEYPMHPVLENPFERSFGTSVAAGEKSDIEGAILYQYHMISENRMSFRKPIKFKDIAMELDGTRLRQFSCSIFIRYEDMGGNIYDSELGNTLFQVGEEMSISDAEFKPRSEHPIHDPELNVRIPEQRGGDDTWTKKRSRWEYMNRNSSISQLVHDLYTYWKYKRSQG